MKLPCPRFEFRWRNTSGDWSSREVDYNLVIPLKPYDCRGNLPDGSVNEKPSEYTVLISTTKVSGGKKRPVFDDGIVDTPFRDGAHASWDRAGLDVDWPIIAVCEDTYTVIEPK